MVGNVEDLVTPSPLTGVAPVVSLPGFVFSVDAPGGVPVASAVLVMAFAGSAEAAMLSTSVWLSTYVAVKTWLALGASVTGAGEKLDKLFVPAVPLKLGPGSVAVAEVTVSGPVFSTVTT